MLRSTTTRSFLKALTNIPAARSTYNEASAKLPNYTIVRQLSNKRPQVLLTLSRPATTSLPYATKAQSPFGRAYLNEKRKVVGQKLAPTPKYISTGSEGHAAAKKGDDEMLGGIRADIETIRETFALTEVPRESLLIGAAGVIPYAATSLSTVFLAYDINHAQSTGQGLFFSPETAHQLLDLVTPIQIGYGAVIISFLGAIHWGLEYAGYGGHHSYRRFMYGVIAPAVAWPTIFMPVEYALITQFLAFNFLYFADARATVKGWFPPWYSTYRFVLTFFVGASIVISLVGRGQIDRKDHIHSNPIEYLQHDDTKWAALEREEKQKRAQLAQAEEGDEEDGDSQEEEEKED